MSGGVARAEGYDPPDPNALKKEEEPKDPKKNEQPTPFNFQYNPPNQRKGSAAATAMAAAAAGMQMLMCMKLMNEARKEPDPDKKMMLQMMAMQQCNQAAESAKNAKDNKETENKLSAPEPYKMPEVKLASAKPAEKPKENFVDLQGLLKKPEEDDANKIPQLGMLEQKPIELPKQQAPEQKVVVEEKKEPPPVQLVTPVEKTILPGIDRGRIAYDENARSKNGDNPSVASAFGLGGGMGLRAGSTPGVENKIVATEKDLKDDKSRKNGGAAETASGGVSNEGSSNAAGGGGGGGGPSSLDAMLASIMGGGTGAGAGDGAGFMMTGTPIWNQGANSNQNIPSGANIFDIATARYHKAAYEEGIVNIRNQTYTAAVSK